MRLTAALRQRLSARRAPAGRGDARAAAEQQAALRQAEAWKKPGGPIDPGFVG